MILHAGLKPGDYAERLEELIKSEHLAGQDGGTPEQWANESVRLAQAGWVRTGRIWMKAITSGNQGRGQANGIGGAQTGEAAERDGWKDDAGGFPVGRTWQR